MKIKLRNTKFQKYLLALSALILVSAIPFFAGSGLDDAEPLDSYLNGNFPSSLPQRLPYEPVFPNLTFDSPLTFNEVPNTNKIIIGQRDGQLFWFDKVPDVTTKNVLLDLSDKVGLVWDGGFLGLALHPEFGTVGKNYFYAYYSTEDSNSADFPNFYTTQSCHSEEYWGNFLVLVRYEMDPVTLDVQESSEQVLLKLRMYGTTHRGGGLLFGDDGFLYLTTGDQTAFKKAQDITNNLDGGVLRLDVDMDNTKSHPPVRTMPQDHGFFDEITGNGYWIPNDNPFLSPAGHNFEEYYSLGHRNPHRMTKDRATGDLYVGEIGGGRHEEINVVKKGKNYGWPVYEGLHNHGTGCVSGLLNGMAHEQPLTFFPRSQANAIIGGFVYRGSEVPELQGKYICADYGNGEEIWSIDIDTGDYTQLGNFTSTNIISFGEDQQAELYIMKLGVSTLYKMVTKDDPFSTIPQFLSETGAFQDLNTLEPTDGLIPYDLVESFWSDGALKKRWVGIPNDGSHNTAAEKIQYSENDVWNLPVGSVLVKHFELPVNESNPTITKRLETRFSVKAANGNFYFATYKWNDQETDAELLTTGLDETINIVRADGSTSTQTWQYPSNSDCISCHNPTSGGTLGMRTRYLNKDFTYSKTGRTANQLVTLSHLGILDQLITDADTGTLLTAKAMNDPNATIDDKARSYMDLNCAYCHRPGTGNRGNFDLRLKLNMAETGLLTASPYESMGIPEARIIDPGDTGTSLLYHRLNSTAPAIKMPPIAKNELDDNAIALIGEWIGQLTYSGESSVDVTEGIYYLESKSSGKIIEIADALTTNGANVQQGTYADLPNQQFEITKETETRYTLKAEHSDKHVEVAFAGQAPGTNVRQNSENQGSEQAWSFEDAGNGYVYIISKANGLYLDVANASNQDGANIQVWTANNNDAQKWKLNRVNNETTLCVTIDNSYGDVEEINVDGSISPWSSDLELITDGNSTRGEQTLGLRFNNVAVPQGASVKSAYLQFTVDEVSTGSSALVIRGEDADDADTFVRAINNVSQRVVTSASRTWSPPSWNTVGESDIDQRSGDLSAVVQEIIDRPGYAGNSMAFIITGSGTRIAESYDGSSASAPKLCITYTMVNDCEPDAIVPEYTIDGVIQNGFGDIILTEGQTVELRALSNEPGATITLPDGTPVGDSYDLGSVSASANGTYIFETQEGCRAILNIEVIEISCPAQGTPCDDGDPDTTNDVEDGNCNCAGTPITSTTICVSIDNSFGDVEEFKGDGSVYPWSSDLELVFDGNSARGEQLVGLRFTDLGIPNGATINSAYLQFTVDEPSAGASSIVIAGEASDSAQPFLNNPNEITSRTKTNATVTWEPPVWATVGLSGADQQTADLSTIVQEIVNRPDFGTNSAVAFILSGTGTRTAESYDGSQSGAPKLCISYEGGTARVGNFRAVIEPNGDDISEIFENEFMVFPNPTSGILNLDLKNFEDIALSCTVLNSLQQQVHRTSFGKNHKRFEVIDMDNLADGIYIVIIQSELGTVSKRIILKK